MRLTQLANILLLTGHCGLGDAQSSLPATLDAVFGTTGDHNVRIDTGRYGPPLEEYHYFYDQWPIGLAVSKKGRVFTCYTRGTYAVSTQAWRSWGLFNVKSNDHLSRFISDLYSAAFA
jgi:hypothetical protein